MCMMCMTHMMMDHNHDGQHQPVASVGAATGLGCAHCNYPLQPGLTFCPNCGMSLHTGTCSSCSQAVDPTWKACPYCGAPLSASAPATVGQADH